MLHDITKKGKKILFLPFLFIEACKYLPFFMHRSHRSVTFREVHLDCQAYFLPLSTSGPDHTCNIRYLPELRDPSNKYRKLPDERNQLYTSHLLHQLQDPGGQAPDGK